MDYDYAVLLDKFGRSLGMPGLTFDEKGCCSLLVNGEHSMVIRRDEWADRIILSGIVAFELPDPIDYSLLSELLEYALSPMTGSGPAIGLDAESGMLMAYASLPMRGLDEGELVLAAGRFLEFRDLMAARIQTSDEPARSVPLSGSFMAV